MIKTFIRTFVSLTAVAGLLIVPATAFAVNGGGSASLSITPASGQYAAGSSFTVTVYENSNEGVAGIDASLNYDASKLRCDGVDGTGSAFANSYQSGCGGGSVTIARGTQGTTVTGTQKVASVTFTALATSGSASIVAAASAEIDNASVQNVCNATCAPGAVLATASFTPAPTTPAGGMGGGNSSNSGGSVNGSSSNNSAVNRSNNVANNTPATATDTPAAASGEVKSDSAEKKGDDATKKDDQPKDLATAKSDRNVWPWIILALLGAGAVAYGLRSRKEEAATPETVTNAKAKDAKQPKAGNTDKAAVVATVVTKKAAKPAKTAAQKSVQSRKKSGKKTSKKSR